MKITIKSRQKDIDENYTVNEFDGSFDMKEDRFFIRYTEKLISADTAEHPLVVIEIEYVVKQYQQHREPPQIIFKACNKSIELIFPS